MNQSASGRRLERPPRGRRPPVIRGRDRKTGYWNGTGAPRAPSLLPRLTERLKSCRECIRTEKEKESARIITLMYSVWSAELTSAQFGAASPARDIRCTRKHSVEPLESAQLQRRAAPRRAAHRPTALLLLVMRRGGRAQGSAAPTEPLICAQ